MKKVSKSVKKKLTGAAAVLAAVCVAASILWNVFQERKSIQENNYLIYRLIEEELREEAQSKAQQALHTKSNETTKALFLLYFASEGEYTIGLYEAGRLDIQSDTGIRLYDFLKEAEEGIAYEAEILEFQMQIRKEIKLTEKQKEQIEEVISLLKGLEQTDGDKIEEALKGVNKNQDPLALKASLTALAYQGEYEEAYKKAELLLSKENTLPNQLSMANLSVSGVVAYEEDEERRQLQREADEIYNKLYEKELEMENAKSDAKREKLQEQWDSIQESLNKKEQQIQNLQVERAMNYISQIELFSGNKQKFALKMERAYLFYMKADTKQAKELLTECMEEARNGEREGYLVDEMQKLLNLYETVLENGDYEALEKEIKMISYLMTQEWNRFDRSMEDFGNFMLSVLSELRSGISIHTVTTDNYPEIEVHVSLSVDASEIREEYLSVYEMGKKMEEIEVSLAENTEMSVCLVLDKSGSMGGESMEDAKNAIINFVRSVPEQVKAGLVCFDSTAAEYCPVTASNGLILNAIDSVNAEGGTNIADGLAKGIHALEGEAGNRIIILLSDGQDNGDGIESVKQQLIDKGIQVYSIGFGGADASYLTTISAVTGGKFIKAEDSGALNEIYAVIGRYIYQEYIVKLTVQEKIEAYERRVEVRLADLYDICEYAVGVSKKEILSEQEKTPKADFYQQIGGSYKE